MRKLVVFYSLGGNTRKEAERVAKEEDATICEIQEIHKSNILTAVLLGCPRAIRRQSVKIKPLGVSFHDFDRIIIGCPIWNGYPAPVFNSIVETLPPNKEVELFFCSGGGEEPKSKKGNRDMIEQRKCKLISYRSVTTHK